MIGIEGTLLNGALMNEIQHMHQNSESYSTADAHFGSNTKPLTDSLENVYFLQRHGIHMNSLGTIEDSQELRPVHVVKLRPNHGMS